MEQQQCQCWFSSSVWLLDGTAIVSVLADAQADLSLPYALMPFYWFCHEVAQMLPVVRH